MSAAIRMGYYIGSAGQGAVSYAFLILAWFHHISPIFFLVGSKFAFLISALFMFRPLQPTPTPTHLAYYARPHHQATTIGCGCLYMFE